jgi:hypothetical protein
MPEEIPKYSDLFQGKKSENFQIHLDFSGLSKILTYLKRSPEFLCRLFSEICEAF